MRTVKKSRRFSEFGFLVLLSATLILSVFAVTFFNKPPRKSFAQDTSLLQASPSSVKVTITSGMTKPALTLTSTGSNSFLMYGYPTDYGPGINWAPSSGGMSPGGTVQIEIQVNEGINPGTYTGNPIIKDSNNQSFTIPVSVTVVRSTTSRFVQVTSPNGGETLIKDTKTNITWNYYDIDTCSISYTFGPGHSSNIATVNASTRSYEWTVDVGNTTSTQAKISLLCHKTGIGQVQDQSDNFFTLASAQATATPTSSNTGTGGNQSASPTNTPSSVP